MANYDSSHTGSQIDTCVNTYQNAQQVQDAIQTAITQAKLAMYPVGSIYMSIEGTNPSTFIGGTWTQIKDTFLLAAGDTYINGEVGGNSEHTHTTTATTTGEHILTITEIPKHKHDLYVYNDDFSNGGDSTSTANKKTSPGFTYDVALGANKWTYSQISEVGGNGGHTHAQVATTTSASSSLPPYLAVYVWKRTA